MTPSEALTEAAKEGQVERAAQLFKQYNCGVSGALVAAATNGHLEIMKLLPFKAPCFEHHRQGQRGEDAWNLAAKLVISAAENDRLDVLKFVFPEGPDDDYWYEYEESYVSVYDDEYISDLYNVALEALRKAAAKGHLSVTTLFPTPFEGVMTM
ncbi:hypothetical protein PC129_g10999 [Phytophthora cactorum]|uniref:Ankyrin repeat-containing domain n=1 Tax=Phytophthora cactorum TaxID=29920 RepID=A0A8T1HYX8_9STRA|nr:hypothetical protein Pcac1_g5438 [Phytophthora cactorum]KAG2863488.1 hypothetical protein PC113_g5402 [Phytophthora cactorum]KAG3018353.1 hypothetical protein PC119_g10712 [Phytophthora cactorum]KAG3083467.1 hypothetical protein PC121_g5719 [Phytophthora cactorum]KAG3218184.1 hypothetical protein PC129_g10999 [Phytophthora cactorum]